MDFTVTRKRLLTIGIATALTLPTLNAPAVAAPTIPDDLPVFKDSQQANSKTEIFVTTADGKPAEQTTVHRGDILYVYGSGFNPNGNKGGFPLPVAPGYPNGVWAFYGALDPYWRPSEGAPAENRSHPHDNMAWVMPKETMDGVPAALNMKRTLARTSQPMNDDGSFKARIVVDPPEQPAGNQYGVYVYSAGGSANPNEEHFIPINFDPSPGPSTPKPATKDARFTLNSLDELGTGLTKAGGGLKTKDGATREGDSVYFSLDSDERNGEGYGITKYRGSIRGTIKFNMVDVVVRNPWLEHTPTGDFVSIEVSRTLETGPDETRRIRVPVSDASIYRYSE